MPERRREKSAERAGRGRRAPRRRAAPAMLACSIRAERGVARPVEVAQLANGASTSERWSCACLAAAARAANASSGRRSSGELKDSSARSWPRSTPRTERRFSTTLAAATALEGSASFELSTSLHGDPRGAARAAAALRGQREPAGRRSRSKRCSRSTTRSFWINGWVHDEDGRGEVTRGLAGGGAGCRLTETAYRYERPDVVQFYSGARRRARPQTTASPLRFSLPAASRLVGAAGSPSCTRPTASRSRSSAPPSAAIPQAVRSTILGELGAAGPVGGALADRPRPRRPDPPAGADRRRIGDRLGRRLRRARRASPRSRSSSRSTSGSTSSSTSCCSSPAIPDLAAVELIYVLDSVEQRDELARQARELFALYGLPFRVVNLTAGAGFAGANNHGIEVARGRAAAAAQLRRDPRPAGLDRRDERVLRRTPRDRRARPEAALRGRLAPARRPLLPPPAGSELWENAHCFKGLHRSFPAANVARPVPAVTAACMMIDRDLYEEVGGLPLHYVQGDYEDSELCLRLAEAGRQSWYLPAVELYHLEGQSYVAEVRRVPSEYNMWLHTALWGDRIEERDGRLRSRTRPAATKPARAEAEQWLR